MAGERGADERSVVSGMARALRALRRRSIYVRWIAPWAAAFVGVRGAEWCLYVPWRSEPSLVLNACLDPIAVAIFAILAAGIATALPHLFAPRLGLRMRRARQRLVADRPGLPHAAGAIAAALTFLLVPFRWWFTWTPVGSLAGTIVASLLVFRTVRRALRSPTPRRPLPPRLATDGINTHAVALASYLQRWILASAAFSLLVTVWLLDWPYEHRSGFKDDFGWIVVPAYVALVIGGTALVRQRARVVVGIDGILLRGLGLSRFYPHSDLASVEANGANVVLLLASGAKVRLQLDPLTPDRGFVAHLRETHERAHHAQREVASVATVTALREAAARGPDATAALSRGARGYREPAIAREDLWELVEGANADPLTRLLAARVLALASVAGDGVRLRTTAARCASPAGRVALRELAEDEACLVDGTERALRSSGDVDRGNGS